MSQDQEKKRKRHSQGTENSAKRLATESGIRTIRVSQISVARDAAPVIGYAPGLQVPQNVAFKPFRKGEGSKAEFLLHSSDHPKIDYTAREHQEAGAANQLKHYIGIFDPASNSLQVVEARNLSVRGTLRSEDQVARDQQRNEPAPKAGSKRQELGLEFGTKKAKKAIASVAQNAISPPKNRNLTAEAAREAMKADPAAQAVLESMAAPAADAPTLEAMEAAVDEAKPRPKANTETSIRKDIYPIEEIVGENVMKYYLKVKPWHDAWEKGKPLKLPSQFVAHRITSLCEDDKMAELKVAKYILVLLQFLGACRTVKGGGRKLPERDVLKQAIDAPEAIIDIVRKRFCDGGTMTKWHVDNIWTHLAVLSLIVDEFETDIFDLSEDLQLKPSEMAKYFAEVGAKPKHLTETQRDRMKLTKGAASMHRIAILKAPVKFPKQKKGAPNRRR